MTERASIMRAKFMAAGLAVMAILIGAECVRAGVARYDVTGSIAQSASATALIAAELDPTFAQKLVDRVRGPYQRSRVTPVRLP
jgi:hypothetical protein